MPLSQRVARFNRRILNPLTRQLAGWAPGFAIIVHTGRRSGRVYHTPVNAFRDGDDYLIALTYGAEADWVRNVLESGGCKLLTRGRAISLIHPRIVTDPDRRWAPPLVRLILGLINAPHYLRMTQTGSPEASA